MRARSWLAALIIPAAAGACRHEPAHETPPTPVVVRSVQSYEHAGGIRYSGAIEPNLRVDVAFKAGGYVQSLLQVRGSDGRMRDVQDGDTVTRGVVLASLQAADYAEKRKQAFSQLQEAEASLAYVTSEHERAARLFAAKSLTKPDLDAAKTQLDVTKAKLEGARAMVQSADIAIADTSLKSPIDGTVMKRLVEVGSLAGPGTPGFVLADTSQVKVVFGAADTMLRTLKVGAPQTITTAALPGQEFRGRITRIAPVADAKSRVFDVEVSVANPNDRLKVGMVASLQVGDAVAASAPVVVPLAAIVRDPAQPEGYAVFIIEQRDGKPIARVRAIQLGQAFGNSIAVTRGLKVGEHIVVSGATLLTDGEPVKVAFS